MKYKIGELEVEAVQWNGDNKSEIINTWPGLEEGISVNEDLWGHYTLSILWVNNRITYGDYIVKSKDGRFFVLDNQDFNKIATKVKEPRFKVGDVVYYIGRGTKICKSRSDGTTTQSWPYIYRTVDKNKMVEYLNEDKLLTLEEAIEKLKEL